MFIAFFVILNKIPDDISFIDSLSIAGSMGKLEIVNFSFDPSVRYTFWTGITGGLFLALSYFGTDQSQVQRYLGGKSVKESRLGLMFNALLKVPMQFFILLCGLMVFVFFQFQEHPVLFDQASVDSVNKTEYADEFNALNNQHLTQFKKKRLAIQQFNKATEGSEKAQLKEELLRLEGESKVIRNKAKDVVKTALPGNNAKDSDYVFLSFILNYLPTGLVGLLLAVIISAAMSSTAGELNALGSTTLIDFYQRLYKKKGSDKHYVIASKAITALWGVIAIIFALFANMVENLIEAVNILGSLFYGTILGIFMVAFFLKRVGAKSIFISAIISEIIVISIYVFFGDIIAYLWLNIIGCLLVMALASSLALFGNKPLVSPKVH